MVVVLPAPLMPTTRMTKGLGPSPGIRNGCSHGASSAVMSAARAFITTSGVRRSLRPSFSVSPSRILRVASRPTSAMSKRVSSSSSSVSSRRFPPRNRVPRPSASPARVLLNPARMRPSQPTVGTGAGASTGWGFGAGGAASTGKARGGARSGCGGAVGASFNGGRASGLGAVDGTGTARGGIGADSSGSAGGGVGRASRAWAGVTDRGAPRRRRRRATTAPTAPASTTPNSPKASNTPCSLPSQGIQTTAWASHSRTWITTCSTRLSSCLLAPTLAAGPWAAMLPPGFKAPVGSADELG